MDSPRCKRSTFRPANIDIIEIVHAMGDEFMVEECLAADGGVGQLIKARLDGRFQFDVGGRGHAGFMLDHDFRTFWWREPSESLDLGKPGEEGIYQRGYLFQLVAGGEEGKGHLLVEVAQGGFAGMPVGVTQESRLEGIAKLHRPSLRRL